MPRAYPAEFRLRAVALVRAGKSISKTSQDLGVSEGALYGWVHQDRVDRGESAGTTTVENTELKRMRKRVRELEMEVEILRSAEILLKDLKDPKGFTR